MDCPENDLWSGQVYLYIGVHPTTWHVRQDMHCIGVGQTDC